MNALGRALTGHRDTCPHCTRQRACSKYLQIARDHTEQRRIWTGSTAPSTRLDVREAS